MVKLNLSRPIIDTSEISQTKGIFEDFDNQGVTYAICGEKEAYKNALKNFAHAILDSDLNPYEKYKMLERIWEMVKYDSNFKNFFEEDLKKAIAKVNGLYLYQDGFGGTVGYGNSFLGDISGDHVTVPGFESGPEKYEEYKNLLAHRAAYYRKIVEKILAFDDSNIHTVLDLDELRDLEILFREMRSMREKKVGMSEDGWNEKAFEEKYGVTEDKFLDAEEKIAILKIFDVINGFGKLEPKITEISLMAEKDPSHPDHKAYLFEKFNTHQEFTELMAKIADFGLDIIKMQQYDLPLYVTWEYLAQLGQQLEFTAKEKESWDAP